MKTYTCVKIISRISPSRYAAAAIQSFFFCLFMPSPAPTEMENFGKIHVDTSVGHFFWIICTRRWGKGNFFRNKIFLQIRKDVLWKFWKSEIKGISLIFTRESLYFNQVYRRFHKIFISICSNRQYDEKNLIVPISTVSANSSSFSILFVPMVLHRFVPIRSVLIHINLPLFLDQICLLMNFN